MTNVATVSETGWPNNVSLVNIVSWIEHSIMVLSLKLKTPSEALKYRNICMAGYNPDTPLWKIQWVPGIYLLKVIGQFCSKWGLTMPSCKTNT